MQTLRSQGAMEYLTTYGWAILIIIILIAALFAFGTFHSPVGSSCETTPEFSCTTPSFSGTISSGGILTVSIDQGLGFAIYNVGFAFIPSGSHVKPLPNALNATTGVSDADGPILWMPSNTSSDALQNDGVTPFLKFRVPSGVSSGKIWIEFSSNSTAKAADQTAEIATITIG